MTVATVDSSKSQLQEQSEQENKEDKEINSESTDYRRYVLLPARRYASAGLCDSDVSVCLSVCPSVTRRYCA